MKAPSPLPKNLDDYDYLDLHVHLEKTESADLSPGILYFASSVDGDSWKRTGELARINPAVIPLCGIHPMRASSSEGELSLLTERADEYSLIGEIGLDFHWVENRDGDEAQRRVFRRFLTLASATGKPPTVHTKGAEGEILETLKEFRIGNALIHWYSGPEELIPLYLDLGCYFTIGPDIFAGATLYRQIPEDRLFCETDYPTGMPWICGGEEKTDDIIEVYRKTASLLGRSEGELSDITRENLLRWLEL